MGSFSIWHWGVVCVAGVLAAGAVGLLVWAIRRAVSRPDAQRRQPPSD
jgi:Sec-independent protein translocase protein TatA